MHLPSGSQIAAHADATDHTPVINTADAPRVIRKQRHKPGHLGLGQQKQLSHPTSSVISELESAFSRFGNLEYGSRPETALHTSISGFIFQIQCVTKL